MNIKKKISKIKQQLYILSHLFLYHYKNKITIIIVLSFFILIKPESLLLCEDNNNIKEINKNEGVFLFSFFIFIYFLNLYFLKNNYIDFDDVLSEISSLDMNLDIADAKDIKTHFNVAESLLVTNQIIDQKEIIVKETFDLYYADGKS